MAGCNSHIAVTLSGCVYNPRVDRFVVDGVLTSVGSTYLFHKKSLNPFIVGLVSPYGTNKNDHNSKSNDLFQILLTDS